MTFGIPVYMSHYSHFHKNLTNKLTLSDHSQIYSCELYAANECTAQFGDSDLTVQVCNDVDLPSYIEAFSRLLIVSNVSMAGVE